MNWQHFQSIAWLRWKLSVNQWKRGGSLNVVLGAIVLGAGLILAGLSFFVALLLGIFAMSKASPDVLLLIWDVIVVVFLFMWVMGLVTELQKSEALSPEKLLHLPVSLTGVYLLNYFSTWISLTLIIFLPATMGLSLGLIIAKGPAMLILFPLLLSFVIMITAVTHQFRGWLQILMVNKRRRRTIIAFVTGAFILLVQIPNFINIAVQRSRSNDEPSEYQVAIEELQKKLEAEEIDREQFQEQQRVLEEEQAERRKQERERIFRRVVNTATWVSTILPIGWLPLGARSAAAGSLWPGLLGACGALLIGAASLRRSYSTTLRFYTGGFGAGGVKKKAAITGATATQDYFLEKRIARVPEQATAVMLGGLRSMLRGPEGKMLLITPILLLGIFSAMFFWRQNGQMSEAARPFVGIGAIGVSMLCFVQALCNQFGFDRSGFRLLVLSPCPRRHILLGKNLAIAPLALGAGTLALVVVQVFVRPQITHALANVVQLLSAYVLFCLLGNVVSVVAPSAIANGALKPAKSKVLTVLIHMFSALASPVVVAPAAMMLGLEVLFVQADWLPGIPIYLIGSLAELAVAIWLYRRLLPLEARFLQSRELAVLDAVTARTQ